MKLASPERSRAIHRNIPLRLRRSCKPEAGHIRCFSDRRQSAKRGSPTQDTRSHRSGESMRICPMPIPNAARGFFVDLVDAGFASLVRALLWAIMDISARDLISGQASTGPFGSPVFGCAGKTDPRSSSHPLADLGAEGYVTDSSLSWASSFIEPGAVPSSRPALGQRRRSIPSAESR
jgi:hypothetical protein